MNQIENKWTFPEKISFTDAYTYYSKIESDRHIPEVLLDCTRISEIHASFLGFLITLREKVQKSNGILLLNCSEYMDKILHEKDLCDYLNSNKNSSSFKKSA